MLRIHIFLKPNRSLNVFCLPKLPLLDERCIVLYCQCLTTYKLQDIQYNLCRPLKTGYSGFQSQHEKYIFFMYLLVKNQSNFLGKSYENKNNLFFCSFDIF